MIPHRGEVWWAALDPTLGSEAAKTRRCVVMTRDIINANRRTVVVIPLSSSPHPHPPILVGVTCQGKKVVAVVDQIRAIAREWLREAIEHFRSRKWLLLKRRSGRCWICRNRFYESFTDQQYQNQSIPRNI